MNNFTSKAVIALFGTAAVMAFIGGFWNPWQFITCGICLIFVVFAVFDIKKLKNE